MTLSEANEVKCQHEGCTQADPKRLVDCFYPDNNSWQEQEGKPDVIYCVDHAYPNGFCWSCGLFYAGMESFDFAISLGRIEGLCENCEDSIRADTEDLDDYTDPDYEYYGGDLGIDTF